MIPLITSKPSTDALNHYGPQVFAASECRLVRYDILHAWRLNANGFEVTGTSSGIGRAFAELLSTNPKGYRLVAAARNISALDYLPDTQNVLKLTLDIVSPTAISDAVHSAIDTFSRIDVLINNAGYSLLGDTETTTDEQAKAVFETLFWGATNLTREAVRVMREENSKSGTVGGVVIYMSSAGGRVALPGGSYYFAT